MVSNFNRPVNGQPAGTASGIEAGKMRIEVTARVKKAIAAANAKPAKGKKE